MFRDKSGVYTSFTRRLFLAVNCGGGGGDSSGCNTGCVAGPYLAAPGFSELAFLLPRVSPNTSLCCCLQPCTPTCWEPCTLLLGSITAPLEFRLSLGVSLTCKSGQDQERAHLSCHRFAGGGGEWFTCGPLKSPAATEQTGNPNSQDPASQPLAVGLGAHSSSNYVV